MTDKFYKLGHDFDRFGDYENEDRVSEDGYLDRFEGDEDLKSAFFYCASIALGGDKGIAEYQITEDDGYDYCVVNAQMPKEILFVAERKYLSMTDFPNLEYADCWPVMSRKMAEVLLSVGDFPHQIIPVSFVDHLDMPIECDYVILHLTERSDLLDTNKSIYTREPVMDDSGRTFICDIEKLVLKEPGNVLPPMFRVKWTEVYLFVSAEAKIALEAAGIQGLRFNRIRHLYSKQTSD
jgi:hypothetical protein